MQPIPTAKKRVMFMKKSKFFFTNTSECVNIFLIILKGKMKSGTVPLFK